MPEIEYLTVANHAEAINGMLYLQGAGWTNIQQPMTPQGVPAVVNFGIAVSILIGWNETNRRFPLVLRLSDEDGNEVFRVDAQAEAGRPAGVPVGSPMRSVLALNAAVQFGHPGGYELRADLEEAHRNVTFQVQHVPMPGSQPAA
jgi:hypothetical protein